MPRRTWVRRFVIGTATSFVIAFVPTAAAPSAAAQTAAAQTAAAQTAEPDAVRDVVLIGNSAEGSISFLDGRTWANLGKLDVIPDLQQRLAEMDLIERIGYETTKNIKGGNRWADDFAVSPDGLTLYLSRGILADVVAFDLVTHQMKWRFEVEGFHSDHMALQPGGARMVVSDTTASKAHVLNTATGARIGSFTTGSYPHGNDYSVNGQRIYNSSIGVTTFPKVLEFLKGPRRITVADANTLRVIRTYEFAHGIRPAVFLPDETLMYAQLSYLNGFIEYDLTRGVILRTIQLPYSDAGRRMSPDDYPQNSAHHGLAMSGNGAKLCAAGTIDNYVAIVSRPALTVDRLVSTGNMPYWATTSVDGNHCLVTNSVDDTVSVISYQTASEVARIPVGDFPQRERLGRVPDEVIAALG